jgi:hypothetical protein
MTSDTDDLEEALRQNLELRRELAAEVAKAKDKRAKQGGGIAYRLGWVLYWICVALALLAALVSVAAYASPHEPNDQFLGAAVTAVVLYGLGRAFRYVLSAKP